MRARIRTIKPEAFTDEALWDLEQETGLPIFRAFSGLWCHADREGRFEWRPRALKAGILPYWDGDFSRVLDALATRGRLVRYTVDGRELGMIPNFKKHQAINAREEDSKLPALSESNDFNESDAYLTRGSRDDDACLTRHVLARGEGKGTEGNGREGEHASETRPTAADPHRATPCPPEPLSADALPMIADKLGVSVAAVKESIREFVTYWTIGGGEGRTFTRQTWASKCRQDIIEKQKKGKLVEPPHSEPEKPNELRPADEVWARIEAQQIENRRKAAG